MSEQDIYYNALRKAEIENHYKHLKECDNDFSKKVEKIRHTLKMNMITCKQNDETKNKVKGLEL